VTGQHADALARLAEELGLPLTRWQKRFATAVLDEDHRRFIGAPLAGKSFLWGLLQSGLFTDGDTIMIRPSDSGASYTLTIAASIPFQGRRVFVPAYDAPAPERVPPIRPLKTIIRMHETLGPRPPSPPAGAPRTWATAPGSGPSRRRR
jgi:hypothetical protein